MAQTPTDENDKPRIPISIFDCGELDIASGLVKRNAVETIFNQDKKQDRNQVYSEVVPEEDEEELMSTTM